MNLTRRQALVALGGLGVGAGAYGSGLAAPARASEDRVETATAVAEVVYPSAVAVDRTFVEGRLFGRTEPRPGHFDGLERAIDELDGFARSQFGAPMSSLAPARRVRVLDELGVYAVHPASEGTTAERVRYYLVNDLLYVLFTHPTGGALVGVPNPPGYPGGNELYQRGPER
jgi:hypothetical protein